MDAKKSGTLKFSSKHSDLFIMNLSTSVSAASYSFVLIYAYTPEVAATTFPGSFCIHFLQNSTDSFVLPSSRSTVAFLNLISEPVYSDVHCGFKII